METQIYVIKDKKNKGALGLVHTTVAEFEIAALSLRLGLPSTLTRHENGAFQKCSSNRRNLKTPALRFSVLWTENILKTEFFENDLVTIIINFSAQVSGQTQIQNDR